MTIQVEYQEYSFLKASKIIQNQFSLPVIARKWNASGLGKPAGESTIDRWLSIGPDTKNPRFEPWVIGLAALYL
jgi:hypothetical protein